MKFFAIAIALVLFITPVYATSTDKMEGYRMSESYTKFNVSLNAYFAATDSVCIIQQTPEGVSTVQNQQSTYAFLAAADGIKISSSAAADTLSVTVSYLDGTTWLEKSETITLTGQTAVTLADTTIIRINGMVINGSGAQDLSHGVIYAVNDGESHTAGIPNDLAKVLSVIPANHGVSKTCVFTTPDGIKRALIRNLRINSAEGIDGQVFIYTIDRTATYPAKRTYGPFQVFQGVVDIPVGIVVGEKTDCYLGGLSGVAGSDFYVGMEIFYYN